MRGHSADGRGGHVVIVTGGASGIGLATVSFLIEDGWSVGVLDIDERALAEAEEWLGDERVLFLKCDITDEDDVAEGFDAVVDRFGLVNGLVNSAGIAISALAEETEVSDFRRILDINLIGSFICARAAMERMGASLSIVNIASVSALRANRGRTAYGASKAGVKMMTEIMALETATAAIRINCIAPGPIDTPLVRTLHSDAERNHWLERTPMGHYGTPGDVARAVRFLLGPDASYITGQTLCVDGGFAIAGIIKES